MSSRSLDQKTADAVAVEAVEVSVLVPVYNNVATLDSLLDRVLAVMDLLKLPFEVVCVDDGSSDTSLEILRRRATADSRIRVFALTRNFGSQAASCAACDLAKGRRIVHIDADLENLPEDIPRLLEQLDRGHDLVCGFRESLGERSIVRRLFSFLTNAYVRRETGRRIRDVGCGFRAFRADLVRDLASEGEARRLLTPVLLRRARSVAEVPVRYQRAPRRSRGAFLWLFGIALDYYLLTARRPFLISGLLSCAACLLGVVLLALGPRLPGLIIVSAGSLGGLISLVGQYVQRLYHLTQGRPFYELRTLDDGQLPR